MSYKEPELLKSSLHEPTTITELLISNFDILVISTFLFTAMMIHIGMPKDDTINQLVAGLSGSMLTLCTQKLKGK